MIAFIFSNSKDWTWNGGSFSKPEVLGIGWAESVTFHDRFRVGELFKTRPVCHWKHLSISITTFFEDSFRARDYRKSRWSNSKDWTWNSGSFSKPEVYGIGWAELVTFHDRCRAGDLSTTGPVCHWIRLPIFITTPLGDSRRACDDRKGRWWRGF